MYAGVPIHRCRRSSRGLVCRLSGSRVRGSAGGGKREMHTSVVPVGTRLPPLAELKRAGRAWRPPGEPGPAAGTLHTGPARRGGTGHQALRLGLPGVRGIGHDHASPGAAPRPASRPGRCSSSLPAGTRPPAWPSRPGAARRSPTWSRWSTAARPAPRRRPSPTTSRPRSPTRAAPSPPTRTRTFPAPA